MCVVVGFGFGSVLFRRPSGSATASHHGRYKDPETKAAERDQAVHYSMKKVFDDLNDGG